MGALVSAGQLLRICANFITWTPLLDPDWWLLGRPRWLHTNAVLTVLCSVVLLSREAAPSPSAGSTGAWCEVKFRYAETEYLHSNIPYGYGKFGVEFSTNLWSFPILLDRLGDCSSGGPAVRELQVPPYSCPGRCLLWTCVTKLPRASASLPANHKMRGPRGTPYRVMSLPDTHRASGAASPGAVPHALPFALGRGAAGGPSVPGPLGVAAAARGRPPFLGFPFWQGIKAAPPCGSSDPETSLIHGVLPP